MNPCHSAPNAGNVRRSMANLDWLVVVDQVITETASFWNAPDMNADRDRHHVYFLPCALIYEKPGTILNSGRWIQWRYQAVEPWDEAKPDYEICDLLWTAICRPVQEGGRRQPRSYSQDQVGLLRRRQDRPRPVAWALNGYRSPAPIGSGLRVKRRRRNARKGTSTCFRVTRVGRRRFDRVRDVDLLWLLDQQRRSARPGKAAVASRNTEDDSRLGPVLRLGLAGRTTAASCTTAHLRPSGQALGEDKA